MVQTANTHLLDLYIPRSNFIIRHDYAILPDTWKMRITISRMQLRPLWIACFAGPAIQNPKMCYLNQYNDMREIHKFYMFEKLPLENAA